MNISGLEWTLWVFIIHVSLIIFKKSIKAYGWVIYLKLLNSLEYIMETYKKKFFKKLKKNSIKYASTV